MQATKLLHGVTVLARLAVLFFYLEVGHKLQQIIELQIRLSFLLLPSEMMMFRPLRNVAKCRAS